MTSDQYRVRRPPARPRPPRVESSDEFLVRHGLLPSSERPPPGSNGRQGPPGRALPPPGRGAPPGWPAALGGPTTQRDERSWPDPPQRGVPGEGRRPEAYLPPNGTGARFREVPPAQPDGARRANDVGDGARFDARTPGRRGRADGGAVAEPRRPRTSRPADPAPPGGDHRPPSEPRNGAPGGRRRGELRTAPPVDTGRRRTDFADGPDPAARAATPPRSRRTAPRRGTPSAGASRRRSTRHRTDPRAPRRPAPRGCATARHDPAGTGRARAAPIGPSRYRPRRRAAGARAGPRPSGTRPPGRHRPRRATACRRRGRPVPGHRRRAGRAAAGRPATAAGTGRRGAAGHCGPSGSPAATGTGRRRATDHERRGRSGPPGPPTGPRT